MEAIHGLLELANEEIRQTKFSFFQNRDNTGLIILARAAQDITDNLLPINGMIDANTQTPEIPASQSLDDVTQAVVTGMATAQFQTGSTDRQIKFIVRDQDGLGGYLQVTRHRPQGQAAAVHKGGGFEEPHLGAPKGEPAQEAMKLDLWPELALMPRCQGIDKPKPDIVASGLVLGTWITQTDNQPDARFRHLGLLQGQEVTKTRLARDLAMITRLADRQHAARQPDQSEKRSGLAAFFTTLAAMTAVYDDHGHIRVRRLSQLDPWRQGHLGKVDNTAQIQVREVKTDKFRQILG
jgi:hypothetical protein